MKNLKKGLFIVVVALFSATTSAQNFDKAPQIGVKGGLSFSNLYADEVDDDEMLKNVRSNKAAIGYISAETIPKDVRVIGYLSKGKWQAVP